MVGFPFVVSLVSCSKHTVGFNSFFPVHCALVPDIVETLLPLLSNSSRTRRQVVTQLVRMGLVDNAKELKKQK